MYLCSPEATMISLLFLVLLAVGSHAAPEVCKGVIFAGVKSFGLRYDQYCEVTPDNTPDIWPALTASSARECERMAADSEETRWYNYHSSGACELLSYCQGLSAETAAVTGPAPGPGESCFTQEVLLLIGGWNSPGVVDSSVDVLTEDVVVLSSAVNAIPDAPITDDFWMAGLIGDQVVVCASTGISGQCQLLNVTSGTWDNGPNMAMPRDVAASTVLNEVFYVFGGSAGPFGTQASVEGFYAAFNLWKDVPEWTLPEATFLACAIEHNNYIYHVGGFGTLESTILRLDTINNVYEDDLESMAIPRYGHGCLVTQIGGKDGILVTGGSDNTASLSSTEFYDFDSKCWFSLANMNTGRAFHGMGVLKGQTFIFGGYDGSAILDSVEMYSEAGHEWVTVPGTTLTQPRYYFATVKVSEWTPYI